MLYCISYDLDRPNQNYAAVSAYLTRIGAVRVLESQWAVTSNRSAVDLCNDIVAGGKLGDSDRLLVSEMNRNTAWRNLLVNNPAMQALFSGVAA